MVRSSVVASIAVAAISTCMPFVSAFSMVPSSAVSIRGAGFRNTCSINSVANRRISSAPLALRASESPPPPPATGTKTLSKAERAELNLQMWDAAKNGETEELTKLVQAGAQVNYYQPEMLQATALQWTATNGHADTAKKLIELGASVAPTNQFGWTALHHAANWGYDNVCKVLIENGADPMAKSESGKTPAEAAAFKGFDNVLSAIESLSPGAARVTNPSMGGSSSTADIEGFQTDQSLVPGSTKWGQEDYSMWRDSWGEADK